MPVEPISGLPPAGTITGAELIALVQSGVTVQAGISAVLSVIIPVDVDELHIVTGTTMNLTFSPFFIYGIFQNGLRLTKTVDYTISGQTVTFTVAMAADSITTVYRH